MPVVCPSPQTIATMMSKSAVLLGAILYGVVGLLFIIVLPWMPRFTNHPLDSTTITIAVSLSFFCLLLSYLAYKVQSGSKTQQIRFALFAGCCCGFLAGVGGWFIGVLLGVPLFVALLGMKEFWRAGHG